MNLLKATRSLIRSIWDQSRDSSDNGEIEIDEHVKAIRANADGSDPVHSPDPIAFIYVFATVLQDLVPLNVVEKRKDDIYRVMDKLAEIITELDGSPWPYSRRKCVEHTYVALRNMSLMDENLGPKLRHL